MKSPRSERFSRFKTIKTIGLVSLFAFLASPSAKAAGVCEGYLAAVFTPRAFIIALDTVATSLMEDVATAHPDFASRFRQHVNAVVESVDKNPDDYISVSTMVRNVLGNTQITVKQEVAIYAARVFTLIPQAVLDLNKGDSQAIESIRKAMTPFRDREIAMKNMILEAAGIDKATRFRLFTTVNI